MRNRFNINESEKNRIRGLHGMKTINEVATLGVDLETELDVDLSNVSQNESDWEKDNWDELDDEQKETFRTHDEFKDLEEDEVKEKYNNMEKAPLREIIKNIVSWFRGLFKKDEDEYVGTPLPETSPFKKIEGEIFKGVGKSSLYNMAVISAKKDATVKILKAAGVLDSFEGNVPMFQVERGEDGRRGVKQIDGMYINTQYWKVHQI